MENLNPRSGGQPQLDRYKKGMKDLGRSLILLGCLQAVLGLLVAPTGDVILLAVVVALGALNITLGIFAILLHSWSNYVVALEGALALALNLAAIALVQPSGKGDTGLSGTGTCLGFVIAVGLIYMSVQNIRALGQAREAGADI